MSRLTAVLLLLALQICLSITGGSPEPFLAAMIVIAAMGKEE